MDGERTSSCRSRDGAAWRRPDQRWDKVRGINRRGCFRKVLNAKPSGEGREKKLKDGRWETER